jgi:hypothetical protein
MQRAVPLDATTVKENFQMKRNNGQVLQWVNENARSHEELKEAAKGLGLNEKGTKAQLVHRLRMNLATKDLNEESKWQPVATNSEVQQLREEMEAALNQLRTDLAEGIRELKVAKRTPGVEDDISALRKLWKALNTPIRL